jgi:hypothetical protein
MISVAERIGDGLVDRHLGTVVACLCQSRTVKVTADLTQTLVGLYAVGQARWSSAGPGREICDGRSQHRSAECLILSSREKGEALKRLRHSESVLGSVGDDETGCSVISRRAIVTEVALEVRQAAEHDGHGWRVFDADPDRRLVPASRLLVLAACEGTVTEVRVCGNEPARNVERLPDRDSPVKMDVSVGGIATKSHDSKTVVEDGDRHLIIGTKRQRDPVSERRLGFAGVSLNCCKSTSAAEQTRLHPNVSVGRCERSVEPGAPLRE